MTCMTITMPNFKCLEQVFLELSSSSRYKNIVTVKYSSKTGIPPESTRNPESQPESHRNPPGIRDPDRNFRNRWGSVNYRIFLGFEEIDMVKMRQKIHMTNQLQIRKNCSI